MNRARIRNRMRQYLYRPYKSKYSPVGIQRKLTEINKSIEGGLSSVKEMMGISAPDHEEKAGEAGERKKTYL